MALQQIGEVLSRAERPFAGDPHQIDAAARIEALQLLEQRRHVVIRLEMTYKVGLGQRLGGGKQQSLEDPELLAPVRRRQLGNVGRQSARALLRRRMRQIAHHIVVVVAGLPILPMRHHGKLRRNHVCPLFILQAVTLRRLVTH
jgi:hypothetical protein